MNLVFTEMVSPMGPLTLVADADGLLVVHLGAATGTAVPEGARADASHPVLALARAELDRYFLDPATPFTIPISAKGTSFQQSVWRVLRTIPAGQTRSYGEIAEHLGNKGASRAVGAANGKNPVAIIVPCHRVIGSSGKLVGYAGGLPHKEWLLRHERAAATAPLFAR